MGPPSANWQPACVPEALRARAELLQYVRAFFAAREVLEVETPLLAAHGVTDRNIEGIAAQWPLAGAGQPAQGWLQTSPEYHMKRLLAAGSGSIYQVFRAFRAGERGGRHNPEFSLLEWYRLDFDDQDLMDEVADLVCGYLGCAWPERTTYRQLFVDYLGIDPVTESLQALRQRAEVDAALSASELSRDDCLDALISLVIEPQLRNRQPLFVHGYPPSQAALARISNPEPGSHPQAHRFELYVEGIELCNGYWELTDAQEQAQRFQADNRERAASDQAPRKEDPYLLAALQAGLPDCAGVALGLDRLLMLRLGAKRLDEVLAFPVERA